MKRPTLEYAENCTLIHTYARKLEEYCDELEKALDKACEQLEQLDYSHAYECNKRIIEKESQSTITFGYQTKDEWKEWLMKDGEIK